MAHNRTSMAWHILHIDEISAAKEMTIFGNPGFIRKMGFVKEYVEYLQ